MTVETLTAETVEAPKRGRPRKEPEAVPVETSSEVTNATLRKEIADATRASERILEEVSREVPKGLGGARVSWKDPRVALVERLVPEATGPGATMSTYFSDGSGAAAVYEGATWSKLRRSSRMI